MVPQNPYSAAARRWHQLYVIGQFDQVLVGVADINRAQLPQGARTLYRSLFEGMDRPLK